jgi:hypothetical protein
VAACDGVHSTIGNQDVGTMMGGALQSSRGSVCVDGVYLSGRISVSSPRIERGPLNILTVSYQEVDMRSLVKYVCNHCKIVLVTSKYFGASGDCEAEL